jgi:hypothetical protein
MASSTLQPQPVTVVREGSPVHDAWVAAPALGLPASREIFSGTTPRPVAGSPPPRLIALRI